MKKILLFSSLLLCIVLVSCTKENQDKNTQTINTSKAKLSPDDSITLKNAGAFFESPMTQRDIDSLKEMSSMKFPLIPSRRSALYGSEYTDWSGYIHFQVWTDYNYGHTPNAQVSVGSDWVLVGGGAKTVGTTGNGHFLTASYPDYGLTTWYARSKDHIDSDPHYLYVYAIGMRIDGVSPDYLRSKMQVFPATSGSPNSYPTATASVGSGYLMTGGGAFDHWEGGWGNMLTASYPSSSNAWKVAGKDHRRTDACTIDAYAIGIQNISYPTVGYLQVGNTLGDQQGSGEVTSYTYVPSGWAVTCCGGYLAWSGYGRMIESNYPYDAVPTYVYEVSKDQTYSSSCHNYVYAMRLQKAQ